jgi:hypothetical protein
MTVAVAYARMYRTMLLHRLWLFFATSNVPTNPVYRRFLGCSWRRVEDCYPYPCY